MSGLNPIVIDISLGASAINSQAFGVPLLMVKLSDGDFAIAGVTPGSKQFDIVGDHTDVFSADDVIRVYGSTGNDSGYTIDTVVYNAPNTEIVVDETVPNATVDGGILVAEWANLYKLYSNHGEINADVAYFGVAADVEEIAAPFAQTRRPKKIAVGVWGAQHASVNEALTDLFALYQGFYGFCIKDGAAADMVATVNTATASAFADTNKRLFFGQDSDANIIGQTDAADTTSTAALAKSKGLEFTHIMYHPIATEMLAWSTLCKWLAWNPDERAVGVAYTQLSGVTAYGGRLNGAYTTTEQTNADDKYVSTYSELKGEACVSYKGKTGAGHWLDERLAADWAAARVPEAIAQQFLDTNENGEQIPFDNEGFATIASTIRGVLIRGEALPNKSQHFATDSVNVAYTEYDDLSATQIANRNMQAQFTAKPAGMVHAAGIVGNISGSVPS